MSKIEIPKELIEICKDFASLAKEKGLNEFSGSFSPGIFSENLRGYGTISFGWKQGRHGEDAGEISVTASVFIHTQIK